MARVAVILHERLGNWTRQLRPRLSGLPVRWFETRSAADLEEALGRPSLAHPVIVIDLGPRPIAGLHDLDLAAECSSDGLILVLDPQATEGISTVARELGATHVISGPVPPPVVARLLSRWVELAERRLGRAGWFEPDDREAEPEPWNWLSPYLATPNRTAAPGAASTPLRPGPGTDLRNGTSGVRDRRVPPGGAGTSLEGEA